MTADTEYTAYADQPGVAGFGQEGLARTYYSVCYVKDYVNECQCDELYNFLAGYQPWGGYKFQPPNEPTTPAYRAEILITALGSNKDWLVTDIEQITNFDYANSSGWTQGRIPDQPWQWWGPLDPSRSCSKNVKPSISVDVGNGNYFWMLTSDENNAFQQYCP